MLVGAVTVLVVMVAVFLAYNANAGLPFVPTRELKVDIADGSNLVVGNDVREGGFRVGLVSAMRPVVLRDGQVGAQLTLKLNKSSGLVPVDSRVSINPRSVLGIKFLSIYRGSSSRVFSDGGTVPIAQTSVPVQLDDVFKTFNPRTRAAVQRDLVGGGDALTGRGSAINDTLSALPSLLGHLQPVARYLSQPSSQLAGFLGAVNGFMGALAPVAQVNARLFTDMARTFEAISRDPRALEATISESPSTLAVSTDSLRSQQPFLVDLTTFGGSFAPATAELRAALPDINSALEVGARTLARTPALNSRLQGVMSALRTLALAPGTNQALNGLTDTVGILNPVVRYLGPYVTVCNDWNYWWTNLAGDIDEATTFGFAQRALFNQANPLQSNSVASAGASAPVNGGVTDSPLGGNAFLHGPVYGAAVDSAGNADCETGQRGYPLKLNHLDPLGRNLEADQHTPGDQGTTFTGRAHVPAGETFARSPQTGPQTPFISANP
ncbi:MAG: MlaD family protein [Solirubrobacteraceae bacterium]